MNHRRDYTDVDHSQRAATSALHQALKAADATAPSSIAAWSEYRQAAFRDTGMEGLTGPDAVYHFADAARLVSQAARELDDPYILPQHRGEAALYLLGKAAGFRYMRAAEALRDLLHDEGMVRAADAAYAQCAEFLGALARRMQIAQGALEVDRVAGQRLVSAAVSSFARELLDVSGTLAETRKRSTTASVESAARSALAHISASDETRQGKPQRRRRR